ncbi:MAG: KTSC domain-containing protein [Pedobacter sp.]|nr:MAG: KTSC domain-containing protein [Pedobacter sp.]
MPSSVILSLDYDNERSELSVTYVSGAVYIYKNVPEKTFKHLKAAPSKGTYLNLHIKGKYDYEKVKDVD